LNKGLRLCSGCCRPVQQVVACELEIGESAPRSRLRLGRLRDQTGCFAVRGRVGLEILRQDKGVETVRLQGRDRSLPVAVRDEGNLVPAGDAYFTPSWTRISRLAGQAFRTRQRILAITHYSENFC
jgi:hypothetical protein